MGSMKAWRRGVRVFVALGLVLAGAGCQLVAELGDPTLRPMGTGGGASTDATTTSTTSATTSTGGTGRCEVCTPGSTMPCYMWGPMGTEGVGTCAAGTLTCKPDGSGYGDCTGQVTPQAPQCATSDGHCLHGARLRAVGGAVRGERQHAAERCRGGRDGQHLPGRELQRSDHAARDQPAHLIRREHLPDQGSIPAGKPVCGESNSDGTAHLPWHTAIATDSAGSVIMGGGSLTALSFGGPSIPQGAFLAKFGSDGTYVWSEGLAGGSCVFFPALVTSPQGHRALGDDIAAAGYFCGSIDFGDGPISAPSMGEDGFVAKLRGSDGSGKASDGSWNAVYNAGQLGVPSPLVAADGAGNVILGATFSGSTVLMQGGAPLGSGFHLRRRGGHPAREAFAPTGHPAPGFGSGVVRRGGKRLRGGLAVDNLGNLIVTGGI